MDGLKLTYQVPGDDFSRAGEASSAVKRTLKELGFQPALIRRVAIAMYEAEINMVIHAEGGEVIADIRPDLIDIVFSDTGPGIPDIDQAMQEGYSTATADVRDLGFGAGMGLPNMKKYADEMHITSTVGVGTTVRLTFRVN